MENSEIIEKQNDKWNKLSPEKKNKIASDYCKFAVSSQYEKALKALSIQVLYGKHNILKHIADGHTL